MKTRFKRMRNRSVRFFALDLNTENMIGGGFDVMKFPKMLLYPAFNKG
jgi:hypothetical protein